MLYFNENWDILLPFSAYSSFFHLSSPGITSPRHFQLCLTSRLRSQRCEVSLQCHDMKQQGEEKERLSLLSGRKAAVWKRPLLHTRMFTKERNCMDSPTAGWAPVELSPQYATELWKAEIPWSHSFLGCTRCGGHMSRMLNISFLSQHVSLVCENMPWPTQMCCG